MKKLIPLLLISVLTACTSVQNIPLDAKNAASLKNQTIVSTSYAKPDFASFTAGKATFGLLGALAMISEGNRIVAENEIQDPAPLISAKLMKDLELAHGMRVGKGVIAVTEKEADKIAAQSPDAPFVLDVSTINWSYSYFPTDWTHYQVIYTARARIIDAKTKAVIAENFCSSTKTPPVGPHPTHDELLANKAALLKEKLVLASENCAKEFKASLLGMPAA